MNNSNDPRKFRVEEDALGNVEVPVDHLWGAQTERSHRNFPIGVDRYRWGRPVIRALGILKKCAALANAELGQLLEALDGGPSTAWTPEDLEALKRRLIERHPELADER